MTIHGVAFVLGGHSVPVGVMTGVTVVPFTDALFVRLSAEFCPMHPEKRMHTIRNIAEIAQQTPVFSSILIIEVLRFVRQMRMIPIRIVRNKLISSYKVHRGDECSVAPLPG